MGLTDRIASYIVETRYSDFPQEVIQKAKECFMDSLGATLAGSQLLSGKLAALFAKDVFGPGKARVLGTDYRVNPVGASWANATSNSLLDIDDSHRDAIGHPGAVVFPSAIAFAQSDITINGKRFLEAVVLAYEISIRIAASRSKEKRFSFSTGSWGAYGAAIAAGKLLGLDKEQMIQAIRITNAHHPLPPNRKSYLNFGMVKETTGWASLTGSSAALLAKLGFTGMEPLLDDPEYHDDSVFDNLGKEYKINKIGFKLYPSCRWGHTTLDAVLALRNHYPIEPDQVKEVKIRTFHKASQMTNPSPESIEDAQYSLPFLVSVMLHHGELHPSHFKPENLKDKKILNLASKVSLECDPGFEKVFPHQYLSHVEIMTSENHYEMFMEEPKGAYQNPLALEDLKKKFLTLTRTNFRNEVASQLIDVVLHIEREGSFDWLDSIL